MRDSRHFLSCLANYIIARLWTSVIKEIERSEREKESCYWKQRVRDFYKRKNNLS